jgi:replicative DNA helicase
MFAVERQLALVVLTILNQNKVPDPESVKVLYDEEDMEKVYALASSSYTPSNALEEGGAIDRLRDRYRARMLHERARSAVSGISQGKDPRTVQNELQNDLIDLDRSMESGQVQPVASYTEEAARRLRESEDGVGGIEVGLPSLGRLMNGIEREDLIIVGGRTSQGKTSLALSWLKYHTIKRDVPAAYFALEGSGEEITKRLLRQVGRIGADDVQEADVKRATGLLEDAPLYMDDSVTADIPQVESRVRQLKIDHDVQVVYIDYLQLLKADPAQDYDKKNDRVTAKVRDLKKMARKCDVAVVLVSQLNRGVEKRKPPRPRLSDLREGGEDPADKVALVYRPEHYNIVQLEDGSPTEGYGEVRLVKHRDGPTGDVSLAFLKEYSMWAAQAERDAPTPDGKGGVEFQADDGMAF